MKTIQYFIAQPWMALLFFAVLILFHAAQPQSLVFDEVHYIPASKALITFNENLNIEHPPLAKFIMGSFWFVLTSVFKVIDEPFVFRLASIVFGLFVLFLVYSWMRATGYTKPQSTAAIWLTGFNFLWFIQSKIAMLDIYFTAFGVWGTLEIFKAKHPLRGWVILGLSLACKWSALPFIIIGFCISKKDRSILRGSVAMLGVYFLSFVPLLFLKYAPIHITQIFSHQLKMYALLKSTASTFHPYSSHWWQWPTLLRPMWYTFEQKNNFTQNIWAGGNPLLYWTTLPLSILIAYKSLSKDKTARMLTLLYWVPLLFWTINPRHSQFYYYFLPSSIWLGPIFIWAYEKYKTSFAFLDRKWVLWGFVLISGILFFYFLPIMDGRMVSTERYKIYMWLKGWI